MNRIFPHLKLKTISFIFTLAFAATGLVGIVSILLIDSNVSLVRATWHTYQIDRSEKSKLISNLQSLIGYGGVIHYYKNYLLRNDEKYLEMVQAKLGGVSSIITLYRSINPSDKESKALDEVQQTFNNYKAKLTAIKQAFAQGKSSQEIDKQVYIDDSSAFKALRFLSKESKNKTNKLSKTLTVVRLREALGYGGFIHQFKNAILRSDHKMLSLAKEHLNIALSLLKDYENYPLNEMEQAATQKIRQTLQRYMTMVAHLAKINFEDFSVYEIDQRVIVDDKPALNGIFILESEISRQTQLRSKQVFKVLELLATLVNWLTRIIIFITLLFIVVSLWVVRNRLINPIAKLIKTMNKLADGDFSITVQETSINNELGEMARSIEVFRDNAVLRLEAETKIKSVLDTALDGIVTTDNNGIIIGFNPAAEKLFGYKEKFLIGKNVNILMPEPHKSKHDDYINNHKLGKSDRIMGGIAQQQAIRSNGELFPIEISLNKMEIKDKLYFTGMIRDITARVKAEEKIKKLALTDTLTGLANRYQFEKKLDAAVEHSKRSKQSFALMIIDMDKFKPVNDNYGHLVGDALLIEVANRLNQEKRDTDTVARIGGDEFAVILNHLSDRGSTKTPLARFCNVLSKPYRVAEHDLDVSASVGIALYPDDTENIEALFTLADDAMYSAKTKVL
jgi:diguanylate cyclase (GGDEF)-like protein/PAS domain S-box-containing protein